MPNRLLRANVLGMLSGIDLKSSPAAGGYILSAGSTSAVIKILAEQYLRIGKDTVIIDTDVNLDLAVAASWDSITTNYTVAATRAGKDFYVYLCLTASGTVAFVVSANSTYPSGYTATTSRKLGGFHCLCTAAGTISGHTLTGYAQGAILPASIWDLFNRPVCSPEGMVFSDKANIWVDIYLASGTGANTASVNGGTISDTRDWMSFVDDFAAVKKQLLNDSEFQVIAAGSNEETNILGSADPVTTGGHSDTASRRMISNIGCEDCCGVLWQWLLDQSFQFAAAANHTHSENAAASYTQSATTGNPSADVAPAWAYQDLTGAKGSLYKQGTYGDVKLRAGAIWDSGAYSGSRARSAYHSRWYTATDIGSRGRAAPKSTLRFA